MMMAISDDDGDGGRDEEGGGAGGRTRWHAAKKHLDNTVLVYIANNIVLVDIVNEAGVEAGVRAMVGVDGDKDLFFPLSMVKMSKKGGRGGGGSVGAAIAGRQALIKKWSNCGERPCRNIMVKTVVPGPGGLRGRK